MAALGAGGAAGTGDDDFDQFDKPGAERSWRRRAADEDWDSELEDDLLGEDLLSGKKNQSDLSDEELNDDLLQSDNEDENFSAQGVTLGLNASATMVTSFQLSDTKDPSAEPESEYEQGEEEAGYKAAGPELYSRAYPEEGPYGGPEAELPEDPEYVGEPEEPPYSDEVLDIEVSEPLDEFAGAVDALELQKEVKDESDEEDDEDEESGRLRFKTERKEGTIIRLSDVTRERRNIPETLELSAEAKAALLEFEERERLHKQGRYSRRGGRRGGLVGRGAGDQRRDAGERGRPKEHRPALLPTQPPMTHSPRLMPPPQPPQPPPPPQQPIRSLFQQPPPQPLLPPHHPAPPQGLHMPPPLDATRVMLTPPPGTPQQPKNIHINPHFKGAVVAPVQVPLLPVPSQPRAAVGPQRFPGPPEFPQHSPGPVPNAFSQPPRLPLQDQWRAPPPQPQPPERDPFFLGGDPRFPGPLFLEQRSPPPPPPPPPPPTLLSGSHPALAPAPLPFGQPAPAFGQQGQQPLFPRERPVRPALHPPGPMGILHFGQPGSAAASRPFIPPRQPFLPGPGQPFLPAHAQPGLQGPLHPPLPPPHQPQPPLQPQHPPPQPPPQPQHPPLQHQHQQPPQHHLAVPPPPLLPMAQPPFRPHLQAAPPQPGSRMQGPQRQGPRHNSSPQNAGKRPLQQMPPAAPRNSNLRELPIAPAHALDTSSGRRPSTPVLSTSPTSRPGPGARSGSQGKAEARGKAGSPAGLAKEEARAEPELPEEDEETRLYRLKIEEQKRLRQEILRQKELRRQQQAGARKRELLERLAAQQQQQQQQQLCPLPAQPQEPVPAAVPTPGPTPANGGPLLPLPAAPARPTVKSRLLVKGPEASPPRAPPRASACATPGVPAPCQGQSGRPVKHLRPPRPAPPSSTQHGALSAAPADAQGPPPPVQTARGAPLQGRAPDAKLGTKRTVMHRANSGGGDGPHVGSKVRVIKLSGGGGESDGFFHPEAQPQRLPQAPDPRDTRDGRQQPVRKVTLTKGPSQQPQRLPAGLPIHPGTPLGLKGTQGFHPAKKVLAHGRGRGRPPPSKANLRVVECKPQSCVVSLDGLSLSTTDAQLKSLLTSVGPIQSLQMLPQQRKAIAKFKEPAHALAFQQRYHRHMIDLSHINVALIVE
ncbi:RNA-binding protein 33 isoform X1 [Erinaceus europaeus]|uniref:RNA-binding protein 33 isoform X1 n=1 Tax=Erinaceus europaeus TaxID=9365 RepID=A0ABM3XVK1_ERIEU|nr:RNA-binding protein 33 isoform X1 [Erinaceus europaeus]